MMAVYAKNTIIQQMVSNFGSMKSGIDMKKAPLHPSSSFTTTRNLWKSECIGYLILRQ